ncbi:MAG TPA: YlxR family protein [Ktedonobacterales bacterium]
MPQDRNTAKRKQPPRPRHVPLRTCIACRQSRPKRELIRVVRTPDGHVLLDPTGKKSGRGAYLCARRACWEPALRKGKLEHEFEVTLNSEDRAELEAYIETLPPEVAAAPAQRGGTPHPPKQPPATE